MPQNGSQHRKDTRRIGSVAVGSYVLTFESVRFYGGWRCYWMICAVGNPDELLASGHAPTRDLAEMAAGNVVEKLTAGQTDARA